MATTGTPPRPGQVYRDEEGRLCLYVRTEQRPGRSAETGAGPRVAEHLFVVALPEQRHFGTRWFRADRPLPESLELVVDEGLAGRLARAQERIGELERERNALVATMRRAVALMPSQAAELREAYRRALREGRK